MKSKKWSQNFDWRSCCRVVVVVSYLLYKGAKRALEVSENDIPGRDISAYQSLDKNNPERLGQYNKKILATRLLANYSTSLPEDRYFEI